MRGLHPLSSLFDGGIPDYKFQTGPGIWNLEFVIWNGARFARYSQRFMAAKS
jgi:hypothetical protein